jgi:PAS domain S-box-containing protein
MKKRSNLSTDLIILRQKAELLHKKTGFKKGLLTESEITKLIHELEVHQIELEMQNDELSLAKLNAEVSSQKYTELYDFAPTGYFTLSTEGEIIELNLCGSQLLSKERSYLKNRLFITFVSQDSLPTFNHFLQKIVNNKTKETCEISLASKGDVPIYLQLTGTLAESGDQCVINAIDISERRQIQKELKEHESHNRAIILHTAMDGFYITDLQGYILEVNDIYCQMSGYSKQELIAMHLSNLDALESDGDIRFRIGKIISQGEDRFETQHRRKDGSTFDVEISTHYQNEAGGRFVAFLHDISERKMAERYREMSRDILQILNEPGNIVDLIKQVITLMKAATGIEAVGIRLKKGEDFPYFTQEGFSNDFLSTENSLIELDSNGNSCLVCNCGLVISGKNDPGNPFFTRGGSWWTNNLSQLPDTQYGRELRFHPRNKCIHQGFDSLALVPIRDKDKIVGLIQLNDSRKDRFTLTTIEKLEGIASHIGTALIRSHSEELLRRKEEKRISILQTAMDGFWILNSDGYILEVNDTYCYMSGYSRDELLSLNVSDLECEENEDDIATHSKEVIKQIKDRFETRHRRKDGSIFDVEISTQYRPAEGQFVSFLRDITDSKRFEDDLRYHAGLIENISDAIISTDENFRVKSWNKAAEKIYCWKSEETVGKSVSEILHTEYLTDVTRDEFDNIPNTCGFQQSI